jgi:hypothetical protein
MFAKDKFQAKSDEKGAGVGTFRRVDGASWCSEKDASTSSATFGGGHSRRSLPPAQAGAGTGSPP